MSRIGHKKSTLIFINQSAFVGPAILRETRTSAAPDVKSGCSSATELISQID